MKARVGFAVVALSLILFSFRTLFNIDDVASAISSGNASQLSVYLDSRVDLSLPDKSDSYSRSQAEMIIRDFFNTNGVKHFKIKQKVDNGGTLFCFGVLQTRNGDYHTSLFMKMKGDRQYLQELRFQPAP